MDEIAELRARVAHLERELAEQTVRSQAAVAAAEARVYWLDRYRVDLNALMERPLAILIRRCLGSAGRRARTASDARRIRKRRAAPSRPITDVFLATLSRLLPGTAGGCR